MAEKWWDSYEKWREGINEKWSNGASEYVLAIDAFHAGWLASLNWQRASAEREAPGDVDSLHPLAKNVCPCGDVGLTGHPKNVWCAIGWKMRNDDAKLDKPQPKLADLKPIAPQPRVDDIAKQLIEDVTRQALARLEKRVDAIEKRVQHGLEAIVSARGRGKSMVFASSKGKASTAVLWDDAAAVPGEQPNKPLQDEAFVQAQDEAFVQAQAEAFVQAQAGRGPCPCGMSQADARHPPGWCLNQLGQWKIVT